MTEFRILTGKEEVVPRRRNRAGSPLWRRLLEGQRVFLPGYEPNQLSYWYRKARSEGFALKMERSTVDGVNGTVIERIFKPV